MRVMLVLLAACVVCLACGGGSGSRSAFPSGGAWRLTVYYTPVESYHGGPTDTITGCGGEDLGRHSREFLNTIQTEGFGRLSGPIAGRDYLGWNFDRGCWQLAAAPLGADDRPLRPWVSTAAHPSIAAGTKVSVRRCGNGVDRSVCDRVRAAAWVVDDRCSVGCGEVRHLDLYIGEEDRSNFEDDSPNYFETRDAAVTLSR